MKKLRRGLCCELRCNRVTVRSVPDLRSARISEGSLSEVHLLRDSPRLEHKSLWTDRKTLEDVPPRLCVARRKPNKITHGVLSPSPSAAA